MSVILQLMLEVEHPGAHLVATAPDKLKVIATLLPSELIEQLRAHKSELLILLSRHEKREISWDAQDWRNRIEERAAISEYDGSFIRVEVEITAGEEYLSKCIADNMAPVLDGGTCIRCAPDRSITNFPMQIVDVSNQSFSPATGHQSSLSTLRGLPCAASRAAFSATP